MRNLPALLFQSCSDNLLVWVTLFYITGCCSAYLLCPGVTPALLPHFGLSLLIFLTVVSRFSSHHTLPIYCPVLFLSIGFLHTLLAMQHPLDQNHIANRIHQKTRVTLVGTISSYPEFDGQQCRFTIDTSRLLLHDSPNHSGFEKVYGKVQLSIREKVPAEYSPGMKVIARVSMDQIQTLQTPGVFDYKLFMAGRSIYCSGWTNTHHHLHLIGKSEWPASVKYIPEKIRHRIGLYLEHNMERPIVDIYKALLIGSKATLPADVRERFTACGLMHLLAISGLHLSLLGLLSTLAISTLLRRNHWLLLHTHVPNLAMFITIPLLLGYACIAGLQPPVVRALLMALFTVFAVLIRRQHSLYPIIAAAALVLLIVNPLLLFTASFQLSFSAVLAIAVTCQRLPDVFDMRPETPVMHRWVHRVFAMLLISIAASLGTLPFILYHFNRFSLIGPLMNLVVEPILCLWSLPLGLLAVPFIFFLPDMASFLLQIGGWGINLADSITELAATLPAITIRTITPHPLEVTLFVILLALMISYRSSLVNKAVMGSLGGVILILSFTSGLWLPGGSQITTTTFLDVGQGACTLIELPDGKKILVDGGGHSSKKFDIGERVIAPFLWKKRIWRLDDIVISHPHSDHYNGLLFVHRHFNPNRLIINGQQKTEAGYASLLKQVRESTIEIQVATEGDILLANDKYQITCLGISGLEGHSSALSSNDQSIVLLLEYMQKSILLPGDAGVKAENLLLSNRTQLSADVLIAPHHGSKTSSSPQFIDAVAPEYIVVSSGISATGRLPSPQHLQNWNERGIPTLITAIHGTIDCTISEKGLHIKPYERHYHQRYTNRPHTF